MRKTTLIAGLLGLSLWGCAHKAPELDGAINKDKIPVYANSVPDPKQALAGSETSGDYGSFYGKYWDLKTEDPPEKVIEFYKKALPNAKVTVEEDTTRFYWEFPGAEKGESIEINVKKDGVIHIVEDLKLGKHKR